MKTEFDFSWRRWFLGYWKIKGFTCIKHAFYIGPFAMCITKEVHDDE